jgi:hypothetical protein
VRADTGELVLPPHATTCVSHSLCVFAGWLLPTVSCIDTHIGAGPVVAGSEGTSAIMDEQVDRLVKKTWGMWVEMNLLLINTPPAPLGIDWLVSSQCQHKDTFLPSTFPHESPANHLISSLQQNTVPPPPTPAS